MGNLNTFFPIKRPYIYNILMACNNILFLAFNHRAGDTGGPCPPPSPIFPCSKKKKGKQRKARKTFKAETIKRLSLRLKLYCLSHSRESRIQKFFLSANHGVRQYFSIFHFAGPKSRMLFLLIYYLFVL